MTGSLAAAKKVSMDVAVVAVLSELDDIHSLKELKALPGINCSKKKMT